MANELTNEMVDKIMFRYFDGKFKDSTYEENVKMEAGQKWNGIFSAEDMLVGHPSDDDSLWFSHGPILSDGTLILDMTPKEYHKSMARYIHKKYPHIKIKDIM